MCPFVCKKPCVHDFVAHRIKINQLLTCTVVYTSLPQYSHLPMGYEPFPCSILSSRRRIAVIFEYRVRLAVHYAVCWCCGVHSGGSGDKKWHLLQIDSCQGVSFNIWHLFDVCWNKGRGPFSIVGSNMLQELLGREFKTRPSQSFFKFLFEYGHPHCGEFPFLK